MSLPDIETYSPATRSFIRAFWEAAVPEEIYQICVALPFYLARSQFQWILRWNNLCCVRISGICRVENIMYSGGIDVALTEDCFRYPHALCGVIMVTIFRWQGLTLPVKRVTCWNRCRRHNCSLGCMISFFFIPIVWWVSVLHLPDWFFSSFCIYYLSLAIFPPKDTFICRQFGIQNQTNEDESRKRDANIPFSFKFMFVISAFYRLKQYYQSALWWNCMRYSCLWV